MSALHTAPASIVATGTTRTMTTTITTAPVTARMLPAGATEGRPQRPGPSHAQASISTRAPAGSAATCTVDRAGRWSPNASA